MNNKIKEAIDGLLEFFHSGELPEKIALATNPAFDVPSSKWSLNNRLIQLFHGSMDSRGIKQWNSAGRKIKKGAKALFILAPRPYEYYECKCSMLFGKELAQGKCPKCKEDISKKDIKTGISFVAVPVFKADDTEGQPLPYENIPLPQHRFMDVARAWNLKIESAADMHTAITRKTGR
jgi:hypothetical protein